ncbi:methionine--tRNA ligase [Fervidicoccus fontis]|uniref:Methionine--tRNA ligase n=1 Tax=Fervidicoccus fontis TaxID=683846 RepID=A0A7C2ZA66_9CREN|nr:methionine--tRNA ligase [Fervidicoccus fontis]PMB77194.1 MAG: methionine--tRNA ligase [Fervidicoccus fontis]HEW63589.1 methionine--tRNA ligase [Fervidicoccus fontis]
MGKYVVCAAWPYVNNVPHLGTMIGSLLSGDVYFKFLKLLGEDAVYVSGSDEHGSPIEVEAKKKGIEPKLMTDAMHSYVTKLINDWEITFTNYSRTHNPVHINFVRDFVMKLYENGYIVKKKELLPYCPVDKIFLADRFIEGTCPYCGYEKARGDQCDNCGRLLTPTELINPHCVFCGSKPIYKETEHWFFKMDMLQNELLEWLKNNDELDDNVKNYSINWVAEGLKERSITRDVSWGVPAPFPGAEGKTIYVWFDALLGYISAVKEYFEKIGRSDEFEKWWKDKNTKTIYFIGKDNIPFHAIIFPSMLIASREGYPLPWKISATEYLLFQEEKFSKSRGIGVWADEALEILPADYWRFALIRMRPEAKDTNFSWSEFYRIINSELNDDIGNLVHRVLTFTYKNFNGSVPNQSKLSEEDIKLLNDMERFYNEAIAAYSNAKLKLASDKILEMARRGNQYLNSQAPWDEIKESRERAGTIIYNMLNYVNVLMTLLWPITPSSSEAFYSILNINGPKEGGLRRIIQEKLESGKSIRQPQPIFKKLPPDFLEKIDSIISNARDKVAQKRPKF